MQPIEHRSSRTFVCTLAQGGMQLFELGQILVVSLGSVKLGDQFLFVLEIPKAPAIQLLVMLVATAEDDWAADHRSARRLAAATIRSVSTRYSWAWALCNGSDQLPMAVKFYEHCLSSPLKAHTIRS